MQVCLTKLRRSQRSAVWVGERCGRRDVVGLTEKALSCAARALVPKPARRAACLHVSRAMQAARRRDDFDFTSRLGRRAEAGPRRLLGRVSQPVQETRSAQYAGRLLW